MDDRMLDETLELWKRRRTPKEGEFADAAEFERNFFAKVALEDARAALWSRRWKVLRRLAACLVILGVGVMGAFFVMRREDMHSAPDAIAVAPAVPKTPSSPAAPELDAPPQKALERDMGTVANERQDYAAKEVESRSSFPEGKAVLGVTHMGQANLGMVYFGALGGAVGAVVPSFAAMDEVAPPSRRTLNTEEYKAVGEQPFLATATNPLSTFGADVDTAGYANLRRMILQEGRLPAGEAVRLEELVNYFRYDYPLPASGEAMRPHFEMGAAPWNPSHQLLLVGVQARVIPKEELPPSHYVFLIDNSGSMYDVFPMVKEAMTALARQLRSVDRVSMVTYGGGVSVLLDGCGSVEEVCRQIAGLNIGGYTPGGAGIQTAYKLAEKHFIPKGNNRIVLITDGDFNVGASSEAELVAMVETKRKACIYLSVAGCGMWNYKDNKMKMLANKGNGNYFYLDTVREAKQAFVHGMTGNMYTLARDVKFQVEFNPAKVHAYRLLGYELRKMADTDFRDDARDSGEVGVGQQVTALYEIVPADAPEAVKAAATPGQQPLKYSAPTAKASGEWLTFRMRYQQPQGEGTAVEKSLVLSERPKAGANWEWASAVAEFGLCLRNSKYAPKASLAQVIQRAQKALGKDADGARAEFLLMVHRAQELRGK